MPEVRYKRAYAGSMESMVSPLVDGTNSLLMNKPVGCDHLVPLGAVNSTKRFGDILAIFEMVTQQKGSTNRGIGA